MIGSATSCRETSEYRQWWRWLAETGSKADRQLPTGEAVASGRERWIQGEAPLFNWDSQSHSARREQTRYESLLLSGLATR